MCQTNNPFQYILEKFMLDKSKAKKTTWPHKFELNQLHLANSCEPINITWIKHMSALFWIT